MKTGRFFWGTFFVVIGLLALLCNVEYLQIDWGFSWKLWPLILVFWGVSKFTEHKGVKAGLAVLNGILLACMVFGFFTLQWLTGPLDDSTPAHYTQTLSEPFNSSVERATFHFSGGAGKFEMQDTTNELIEAKTESAFGEYELEQSQDDEAAHVSLSMRDRRRFRFFGELRNRADIRLNASPTWDMRFETGASKLDLDLSPYKTERIAINAGVCSIRMRLGDRSDETNVRVKTGVSSVRIEIPATVGCEIRDNAHMGSTSYDGFSRLDDRRWQTENFDSAPKKIYLEIDAGVSTVRVRRY